MARSECCRGPETKAPRLLHSTTPLGAVWQSGSRMNAGSARPSSSPPISTYENRPFGRFFIYRDLPQTPSFYWVNCATSVPGRAPGRDGRGESVGGAADIRSRAPMRWQSCSTDGWPRSSEAAAPRRRGRSRKTDLMRSTEPSACRAERPGSQARTCKSSSRPTSASSPGNS